MSATNSGTFTPSAFVTQNWQVRKPWVSSPRGIVVAQSRDAAEVGASILARGGNAADTAVATAFALTVTEPWNSGLGGVGFAVLDRPGLSNPQVVDFGPRAPARATKELYPTESRVKEDFFSWPKVVEDRNIHGSLSPVIPSAVAGWAEIHRNFGTAIPFVDLVRPSISLAERGLPVDWCTTLKLASSASVIRRYQGARSIYLPDGEVPTPPYQGAINFLQQGNLVDTLRRIALRGAKDFYSGYLARDICNDLRLAGSIISEHDMADYRACVYDADVVHLRSGCTAYLPERGTAAHAFSHVIQRMLDVRCGPVPDARWYQALATAVSEAYRNRLAYQSADGSASPDGCTSHINVIDKDGMMAAMTVSLLSNMGSGIILPSTGVLLNNGMMWFDPRPGSPNGIGPAKRPLCNMLPLLVRRGSHAWIAAGASGGRRILSSVCQILSYITDFGMSCEAAAHAPRIDVSAPDIINMDRRLGDEVQRSLEEVGRVIPLEHSVIPVNFACPSIILSQDQYASAISDVMTPWSAAVAAP